jgi:membrane fusion protein, copper/silver efflux system
VHELVHGLPKAVPADTADVATRRKALIPAGKLFAELFAAARPSKTFGASLIVLHCPMVEADWLQTDEQVKNFFDLSMTSCGEVKSRLPLDTGAGR